MEMLEKLCEKSATIFIQNKICPEKLNFFKGLRNSNGSTASAWFILFLASWAKLSEFLDAMLYLPKLPARPWIFTVIHHFHWESYCGGTQVLRFPLLFPVFCRSHTRQSFRDCKSQKGHSSHRTGPFLLPTPHTPPLPTKPKGKTKSHHSGNSHCPSWRSLLYLTIPEDSDSNPWWDDNRPHGCSHSVQHNPYHMCRPVATKKKQPRDDDNWELEENKFWSVLPQKATTVLSWIRNLLS